MAVRLGELGLDMLLLTDEVTPWARCRCEASDRCRRIPCSWPLRRFAVPHCSVCQKMVNSVRLPRHIANNKHFCDTALVEFSEEEEANSVMEHNLDIKPKADSAAAETGYGMAVLGLAPACWTLKKLAEEMNQGRWQEERRRVL